MANEATFQREVEANFPWNFAMNVWDILFIMFGMNLVSRATVMPLLVSQLTPSKMTIGLIPAVYGLGYYLPQLLTANYAEGLRRKKPFLMLVGGVGERLPYLLIGLAMWWLAGPAPVVALIVFFLLLGTSAASNGIATPAWFDMIGKVIPVRRRGLYSGLGHGLGALLGVVGAMLTGRILSDWPYPRNFGLCFSLAFVAMVISWVGLALNREPESLTVKPPTDLTRYLRRLPSVLRRDRNYARFLLARSIANLGGMAGGFFMVFGASQFGIVGREVGTLTAVLVGAQAVMNFLWGLVADRRGHKAVLCGAAFSMALAALVGWTASSSAFLVATFGLLGVSTSGDSVSGINIILEFCEPEDRPTYIGLTNTLLAPGTALSPLLGGWLATWAGYRGMFVAALLIASMGGALLALWVREPRREKEVLRV
jgi:MFS family permease